MLDGSNIGATDEAEAIAKTPVNLRSLVDLYFRPSRFFSERFLDIPAFYLAAIWLVGVAAGIDRIDTNLIKEDLGSPRTSPGLEILTESWIAYWAFALIGGIMAGAVIWLLNGWWYRVRLGWSGASNLDKKEVRLVYIFTNVVVALPALLITIAISFAYDNYFEFWMSDDPWATSLAIVSLIFPFWSILVSYRAVRVRFDVLRGRSILWFFALPTLIYVISLSAGIILYYLFGIWEPTYVT